ncbi:MAG: hypothetical protein Q8L55_12545 [Phycisphaerales bacterium]|nr:hypothetical protein [Phycisphaerales bacterium]
MSQWQAKLGQVNEACQRGELVKAKALLQRLLGQQGENAHVVVTMARVLRSMGEFRESVYYARRACGLRPQDGELLSELGLSLARSSDPDAEPVLRRAIGVQPDSRTAHVVLCKLLNDGGRWAELARDGQAAIDSGVIDAGLYMGTASALAHLCRTGEAARVIGQAQLAFPSDYPIAQLACFCSNYTYPIESERVFAVHCNHGRLISQNSLFARGHIKAPSASDSERVLRVAFFSSDLREHSVASFIAPIFANLDRRRFHVTGVFHNTRADTVTERLRSLCDDWVQLTTGAYRAVAEQMRARNFDLAVDLNGVTGGNVLPLFQIGVAPVQVTYLGYPNTTGLDVIGHRFVDSFTDPAGDPYEAQRFAVERLVRLDPCFLCYTPPSVERLPPTGLRPLDGVRPLTLGSFNATFKINRHILGLWKSIMDRLPDARLIFRSVSISTQATAETVRETFAREGLVGARIEVRPATATITDHLAQYQQIDIALDSFPYHGTTTTCEALLMGVPVVSLVGSSHASRVGLSLLTAVGLSELVATSDADYVEKVVNLAEDRQRLSRYHQTLRDRLYQSVLCDGRAMGTRFGAALSTIWAEAVQRPNN